MRLAAGITLAALACPLMAAEPAGKARVSEPQVSLQGRRVTLSVDLLDGFSDEIVERIQSGLPTGFLFEFKLYRDHKKWFDRELDASNVQVVAMYNAVTREYLVNYKQNGKLVESRVVLALDELKRAMSRIENIPAFTVPEVDPGTRLLVRARAELGARTIFSFIPTIVTTDWVESRKFQPLQAPPAP